MTHFDTVPKRLGEFPFVDEAWTTLILDLVHEYDERNLLKLGFFHRKPITLELSDKWQRSDQGPVAWAIP